MKTRKSIFLLLLTALVFLSGCGGKSQETSPNPLLRKEGTNLSDVGSVQRPEPENSRSDGFKSASPNDHSVGRGDLNQQNNSPPPKADPPMAENNPISLLFVGDLMFDRHIRETAEKRGSDYIFEGAKDLLTGNDFVVANLEGPITENKSVSVKTRMEEKNNLIFTFDPSLAPTLAKYKINAVNLGNNHILNFGPEGVAETKKYLDQAKIEYFGDIGQNDTLTLAKEINGLKINFINYNYASNGSADRALAATAEAEKQPCFIVVYTHWGREYQTGDPGSAIRDMAHSFVDAGADLVIGAHPHVIQTSEIYQGKKIYYSLGNFIFDQYWNPETQKGLAVKMKIDPKTQKIETEEIPLFMGKNGQTVILK